jgi:hypothetical protein
MADPLPPPVELERLIVHGLACEWDEACAALAPSVRRLLRRPLFALKAFEHRWGAWSREHQEISLSRSLALTRDWGDVRDVLLHEMAHQVADQALNGLNEPPHGPAFCTACGMLGADPRASGTFPTLRQRVELAANEDGDRETRRIRKLLRLAGSPNRHEAEAAMLKAHELMARHTRGQIASNAPRQYMSVFVGAPALRHSRSCYHLAALLRDFYFVMPVWVPAYVVSKGRMGRVLEISGTPKNGQTAGRVSGLIAGVARREWDPVAIGRGARFDDFVLGILEGLRVRLEAVAVGRDRGAERTTALQKVVDPGLRAYAKRRYGRLVHRAGAATRLDARAMEAGRRIGRSIVLAEDGVDRVVSTARLPQRLPSVDRSSSTG